MLGPGFHILFETLSWCRDERDLQGPLSDWQRKKSRDYRDREDLSEKDGGPCRTAREEYKVLKDGDRRNSSLRSTSCIRATSSTGRASDF